MMPRLARALLLVALALCLAAASAHARKFQMSGTWVYRNGQVFIPLQFATAIMDSMGCCTVVHASMGNLTGGIGFPNGPIPGEGGVTVTGSAPATLRIPPHRFVEDAMVLLHLASTGLDWIKTSFGVDAPHAAATLAAEGGPGSFTWCPGDAACTGGGGMRSTDPPQGGDRNGRVIYRAGANRFGGAMQLGLRRGGTSVFYFNVSPVRFGHAAFGGVGSTLRPVAVGGLGSANLPSVQMVFLPRAHITQPTMSIHNDTTYYPGPKVTTMLGVSTTGTGAIFYLPAIGTGPMGTLAGQFTTHYGFGQTTGTVFAQQTSGTGGQDFFSVMGSDARTPLGAGNLSLVAGGLSFRTTLAGETPYASFQKATLTLGAPIPSLSPAGVAAAAALICLAVGYALRRRVAAR